MTGFIGPFWILGLSVRAVVLQISSVLGLNWDLCDIYLSLSEFQPENLYCIPPRISWSLMVVIFRSQANPEIYIVVLGTLC